MDTQTARAALPIMEQISEFVLSAHLEDEDGWWQKWLDAEPDEEEEQANDLSEPVQVPPGVLSFSPPVRPPHWKCKPCWHFDTAPDIVLNPTCTGSKRRRQKNRKSNMEHREKKIKEDTQNITEVQTSTRVNLPSLNKRTRGSQPSTIFQNTDSVEDLRRIGYRIYTAEEVLPGLKISDPSGNMLVHLYPSSTLPVNLLANLQTSWKSYQDNVSFPASTTSLNHKRGSYVSRVLGCWFKSGRFLQPYMTAHYRGPNSGRHYKREDNPFYMGARQFQHSNQRLFAFIENLIRLNYPTIYQLYKDIRVPEGCHKFTGLFAAVFVNQLVTTTIHKDLGDIKGGICVVINWGDFTGGELVFTELTSVVPFPAGSIVLFRSAVISHWNCKVVGDRYSIVFMTDKRLKAWSDKKV